LPQFEIFLAILSTGLLLCPEFWTNKNTKTTEPYILREGKSGSALRVICGMSDDEKFGRVKCGTSSQFFGEYVLPHNMTLRQT
jgi:hypothetical protein